MKNLIKELCRREGKKSETSISNVRETLRCLADILAEETDSIDDTPHYDAWLDYIQLRRKALAKKLSKVEKRKGGKK